MSVTILGAGIAGAACAIALQDAGVAVQIHERGRAPGGRMASPQLNGRPVDLGAGYFTVRDPEFQAVVDGWADRGLARPWTETFATLAPGRDPGTSSGPLRWATAGGLRTLVRDLLADIEVVTDRPVQRLPAGDVVLAMPDPQAARLMTSDDSVDYDPVIAVVAGYPDRTWTFSDAAFVNDHPDIGFIADDGARRGDAAPVLVAHSTASLARRHLDRPEDAVAPVVAALTELTGAAEPDWTHVHRWTFAKPARPHESTFALAAVDGRRIGRAGDQWCPDGAPRVESAWRSGTDLGRAIARDR